MSSTSRQSVDQVSWATAIQLLYTQRQNTIGELSELMDDLNPVENKSKELGVWTVIGREAVSTRALEFIEKADDLLVYMTIDEMLTDDQLEALIKEFDL